MMRYISLFLTLAAAGCTRLAPVPSTAPDLPGLPESQEAPAAFDSASNGVVDDTTHQADRTAFDAIEEIQERVPSSETIRTLRISLGLLGDGFVEAVPDQTLLRIAAWQCRETKGRICGKAIPVPVLEAPGNNRVGRFGWKDQQASLLSFAADAYL